MKDMKKIRSRIILIVIGAIGLGLILFTVISRITKPDKQNEEILTPVVVAMRER